MYFPHEKAILNMVKQNLNTVNKKSYEKIINAERQLWLLTKSKTLHGTQNSAFLFALHKSLCDRSGEYRQQQKFPNDSGDPVMSPRLQERS